MYSHPNYIIICQYIHDISLLFVLWFFGSDMWDSIHHSETKTFNKTLIFALNHKVR